MVDAVWAADIFFEDFLGEIGGGTEGRDGYRGCCFVNVPSIANNSGTACSRRSSIKLLVERTQRKMTRTSKRT